MKKTLIAAAIMGTCGMASADSNVCNFSTDYNIDINEESVSFNKEDGDSFEFRDRLMLINGKAITLTDEQTRASLKLQQGARAMVPKIAEIAVEGAELGIKATTMVLTSLFGDDMEMQNELIEPIEAISEKIKQNVSATRLNTQSLEKSFDDAFDQEFEKMIEKAAVKYSGKIVSNVLSSIFSGDEEELKDFEFRMENLEKDIEVYVEDNAKTLEIKANSLCVDMAALEEFDTKLETVSGYPEGGLFHQDSNKGINFSDLKINM